MKARMAETCEVLVAVSETSDMSLSFCLSQGCAEHVKPQTEVLHEESTEVTAVE